MKTKSSYFLWLFIKPDLRLLGNDRTDNELSQNLLYTYQTLPLFTKHNIRQHERFLAIRKNFSITQVTGADIE